MKVTNDFLMNSINDYLREGNIRKAAQIADDNDISGKTFAAYLAGEYNVLAKAAEEERNRKKKQIMKSLLDNLDALKQSKYDIKKLLDLNKQDDSVKYFNKHINTMKAKNIYEEASKFNY